MRIRSIKPKSFESEDMTALPRAVRWTYAGLWCYADDEGRGKADPRLIKAALYPIDDDVTPHVLLSELSLMQQRGVICQYEVGGKGYFHIPSFHKHQRPNRPQESILPACPHAEHPPHVSAGQAPFTEPSVSTHDSVTDEAVTEQGTLTAVGEGRGGGRGGGEGQALALRDETPGQRANRLARSYTDVVKLSNFPAVTGVVKKAMSAGYDDASITDALDRLAAEGRSVTTDTLRYEIEGRPAFPARAAPAPISTTNQRVEVGMNLTRHFEALEEGPQ